MTSHASAQANAAQWNFNSTVAADYRSASSGSQAGVAVALNYPAGSNPAAPLSSTVTNGTASDPGTLIGETTYNRALTVNPPLTSAANNSVGAKFNVSTVGMAPGQPVSINWSMTIGYRSSRYWQILATTDGTTFFPVSGGTGSSFSGTVNGLDGTQAAISGTATVTVGNNGLIDFRTIDQNFINAPNPGTDVQGWVNNLSYTLPTGQGFENNPNFSIAIVGSYDPTYLGTDGADGYVSSFSGESTNAASPSGYNRSLGSGGSMRLDLVTVVPEPAAVAAVLGGLGLLLALVRRRRAC